MTSALSTPHTDTASLGKAGLVATVAAGIATTVVAALGSAAGISLDVGGEPIPISGFATLTVLFSLVGVVLAVVLSRRAARPRTAFLRTTLVLLVLSFLPDLLSDAAASTKVLLMTTHLVAAAIVVPSLARRLPVRR